MSKENTTERAKLRRGSTFAREESASTTSVDENRLGGAASVLRPQYRDRFNVSRVEMVLEDTIRGYMKGKIYSTNDAVEWSTELSSLVIDQVKLFSYPRYKVICLITIGENCGGGILSGLRTQWDNGSDAFATYSYVTDTLFVIGTVFGVYYY